MENSKRSAFPPLPSYTDDERGLSKLEYTAILKKKSDMMYEALKEIADNLPQKDYGQGESTPNKLWLIAQQESNKYDQE